MLKRWLRRGVALSLALTLCFSAAPRSSAQGFSDVSRDHWAYTEISAMADRASGSRLRRSPHCRNQGYVLG